MKKRPPLLLMFSRQKSCKLIWVLDVSSWKSGITVLDTLCRTDVIFGQNYCRKSFACSWVWLSSWTVKYLTSEGIFLETVSSNVI